MRQLGNDTLISVLVPDSVTKMSGQHMYYGPIPHQSGIRLGSYVDGSNIRSRPPKASDLLLPKIDLLESLSQPVTLHRLKSQQIQDLPGSLNPECQPVIKVQSQIPSPDLTDAQYVYAMDLEAQHSGINRVAAGQLRALSTGSTSVKLNIRESERLDVYSGVKSRIKNLRGTELEPPTHNLGSKPGGFSDAAGQGLCRLVPPNLMPYMDLFQTRREFRSNTFLMLKVRRDTVPRLTPPNLSWLSDMYGARVYLSNRVATTPLKYLYITNCDVIFDNYLESGSLAVYLNPIPDRLVYMYAQVPNTAYVVQEHVSVMCPDVTTIPHNTTPYSRGHQLQIVADGFTDGHPYGLPLILRTVVVAGQRTGVDTNIQVHNPWLEAEVLDAQEIVDEKDDIVADATYPASQLTEERLQQHDTIENILCTAREDSGLQCEPPPRPQSPASSVGSSSSIFRSDVIEKVERWKNECTITGGPDSKEATRSSVLFESYAAFCGGVNKCGVKRSNDFGKYIRTLWPEDERYWPKKDGKYYRGISLKN